MTSTRKSLSYIQNSVKLSYKYYFKVKTWIRFGRKYQAPLLPYNLYEVCPKQIKFQNQKVGSLWECSVRGGDWDLNSVSFEENIHYKSIHNHFKNNVCWEETELYENALEIIQEGNKWGGCASKNEILELLSHYDDLYCDIKNNGYQSQSDLAAEYKMNSHELSKRNPQFRPPVFNEVTIDVGRDGDLIWYAGQYRLSIARLLELDTIPVRIRSRHKNWQQYRDQVWNNSNIPKENNVIHPDIKCLLRSSSS